MPLTDMQKALALTPVAQATHTMVRNGAWSDATAWDHGVPTQDAQVVIPSGINLTFDAVTPKTKWLYVAPGATFNVKPDVTSKLWVEHLITDMGSNFVAGTVTAPVTGSFSVLFADYGPLNSGADPWLIGRGFIPMGPVSMVGKQVDAWQYSTGNAKGSTVVTMVQPVVGWQVGDQLLFPGTGFGTVDDDLVTIKTISPDNKTITLSSPLVYDHSQAVLQMVNGTMEVIPTTGLTSGWQRPAFVVNRSAIRGVEFNSENSAIARRGHIMCMNMNMVTAHYVGVRNLGRTDKIIVVTDPDGLGNGMGNPRARYAFHFHRNGPDITGMMADLSGLFVDGSPGWGIVNHDSRVDCDNSAVYMVFGASYATEIGTETGCFCHNVSVRNSHPFAVFSGDAVTNERGNADWGHDGHGFWLQAGGVQVTDCIVTGATESAFATQGLPFVHGGVTSMFASKNLILPATYSLPTILPGYVPQLHDHLVCFGSYRGFNHWNININGDNSGPPSQQRGSIHDCYLEAKTFALTQGYSSCMDFKNIDLVCVDTTYSKSRGQGHSGVSTDITFDTIRIINFDGGMTAQTNQTNIYKNIIIKALTGIELNNPYITKYRKLQYSNIQFLPLSSSDMAAVIKAATPYNHLRFNTPAQGKVQLNWFLYADTGGHSFYRMTTVDNFSLALTSDPLALTNLFIQDTLTVDVAFLYMPEEMPNFPLKNAWGAATANSGCVPAFLQPLTNGQLWSQYGMAIGAKFPPSDATAISGSLAYTSHNPPTLLPAFAVAQKGATDQYTNQPNGFWLNCKDSQGNWVQSGPFTLSDKSWNVCKVNADGYSRGVLVYCDSTSSPAQPWSNPPPPPVQLSVNHSTLSALQVGIPCSAQNAQIIVNGQPNWTTVDAAFQAVVRQAEKSVGP